ncbi:MAG TPA: hypothetical protein DCO86_05555 [Spirochaetaceae bacterium]|nr:hypothetical protein [Spirochaetaceae bacterium]
MKKGSKPKLSDFPDLVLADVAVTESLKRSEFVGWVGESNKLAEICDIGMSEALGGVEANADNADAKLQGRDDENGTED